MSEIQMTRRLRRQSVTIGTATETSTTLHLGDMAGTVIYLGTPSTAATVLRMYVSPDDVTYQKLLGSDGAEATVKLLRETGTTVETVGTTTQTITIFTAVSAAYVMPEVAFPAQFIRLVADADLGPAAAANITSKS